MKHQITTFIIAEASKTKLTKEVLPVLIEKSAPHYFEQSVPSQFMIGQKSVEIEGKSIELIAKVYHPDAVLVESTFDIQDIFSESTLDFKDKVHEACYEFAKKYGGNLLISE